MINKEKEIMRNKLKLIKNTNKSEEIIHIPKRVLPPRTFTGTC